MYFIKEVKMKSLKIVLVCVGLVSFAQVAVAKKDSKRKPAQIGNVNTLSADFYKARSLEAKNVTICAAECNSEIVGRRGHDLAKIGTIYYAVAKEDTVNNSNICMSESKKLEIFSARSMDSTPSYCLDILKGNYSGKVVNIRAGDKAIKPRGMADDEQVMLNIEEVK